MRRIPRYLRVIGWIALFWIAVFAAIVVLVVETSGSPVPGRSAEDGDGLSEDRDRPFNRIPQPT
jgi:hypothetical protein